MFFFAVVARTNGVLVGRACCPRLLAGVRRQSTRLSYSLRTLQTPGGREAVASRAGAESGRLGTRWNLG